MFSAFQWRLGRIVWCTGPRPKSDKKGSFTSHATLVKHHSNPHFAGQSVGLRPWAFSPLLSKIYLLYIGIIIGKIHIFGLMDMIFFPTTSGVCLNNHLKGLESQPKSGQNEPLLLLARCVSNSPIPIPPCNHQLVDASRDGAHHFDHLHICMQLILLSDWFDGKKSCRQQKRNVILIEFCSCHLDFFQISKPSTTGHGRAVPHKLETR